MKYQLVSGIKLFILLPVSIYMTPLQIKILSCSKIWLLLIPFYSIQEPFSAGTSSVIHPIHAVFQTRDIIKVCNTRYVESGDKL